MKEEINQKDIIRTRYEGRTCCRQEDIDIFPITEEGYSFESKTQKRVCAYARVSTDDEHQTSSFTLQETYYRKIIEENENWIYVDLYSDEGISGTNMNHREGFKRMLKDCRDGKIDMIITKSVARFARNVKDSLAVQDELAHLPNPVGVYFESEHLYSLDPTSKMILVILATIAEEESRIKSEIMNWSIDKRYELGVFMVPTLLGYDKNVYGELIINKVEAPIVKLVFYLFLNGFSAEVIAEMMMEFGFPRKKNNGNETNANNFLWTQRNVMGILQNEKYCGEFRARKTWTPDFLTHLSKKNNGNKVMYYCRNHHQPIVSPAIFKAVQQLIEAHKNTGSGYILPKLMVINEGSLKGYVPIDREWEGFSNENYIQASKKVKINKDRNQTMTSNQWEGCVVINSQMFSKKKDLYMNISYQLIAFNVPCLQELLVENVSILYQPVEHRIAIIKAHDGMKQFRWGRLEFGEWISMPKSIKGFARVLFQANEWDSNRKYKLKGRVIERKKEKALIFDLNSAFSYDKSNYLDTVPCENNSVLFGECPTKIKDGDFDEKKFIVSIRDCEDVACVISNAEIGSLYDEIKSIEMNDNSKGYKNLHLNR